MGRMYDVGWGYDDCGAVVGCIGELTALVYTDWMVVTVDWIVVVLVGYWHTDRTVDGWGDWCGFGLVVMLDVGDLAFGLVPALMKM